MKKRTDIPWPAAPGAFGELQSMTLAGTKTFLPTATRATAIPHVRFRTSAGMRNSGRSTAES
jgi:hypothetical protein